MIMEDLEVMFGEKIPDVPDGPPQVALTRDRRDYEEICPGTDTSDIEYSGILTPVVVE